MTRRERVVERAAKRQPARSEKQLCFFPQAPLRTAEQVDAEVLGALRGTGGSRLPPEVVASLRKLAASVSGANDAQTEWDAFKQRTAHIAPKIAAAMSLDRRENEFIFDLLVNAAECGFWLALQRYAKHLTGSDEAMAFLKARRLAGDRGRAKQSNRKQSRQTQAKQMLNAGVDEKAIAGHFGVHVSTVYRWLMPSSSPVSKATSKPKRQQ
jgi:hypothetical protein